MRCEDCWYNDYRKTGKPYCILPRCLYQEASSMPRRIERPCRVYLCPNTTSNANGYCDEHQALAREHRGSAYSRGYDKRWEKFRAAYLKKYPICEDCLMHPFQGEPPQPATEVHHIQKLAEHPELKYAADNLMVLCHRHHSIRTARGE